MQQMNDCFSIENAQFYSAAAAVSHPKVGHCVWLQLHAKGICVFTAARLLLKLAGGGEKEADRVKKHNTKVTSKKMMEKHIRGAVGPV